MKYKGRSVLLRAGAVFMSCVVLFSASPTAIYAEDNQYKILEGDEKANDDFADYLTEALSKGKNNIKIGRNIKNISDIVFAPASKIDIKGYKTKKGKKGKIYLTRPTQRVIGTQENQNKRKILFQKDSNVYIGGVDFKDMNAELILEEGADVVFEACTFSNTITNYGKVKFKRKCEFQTGEIIDYGQADYSNNNKPRPKNVANLSEIKLICDSLSNGFSVGRDTIRYLNMFTNKNEKAEITELGFIKSDTDTELLTEMAGFRIDKKSNGWYLEGAPVSSGEYLLKITAVPEQETLPISTIFTLSVSDAEMPKNTYCITDDNIKANDDFKDYLNEAISTKAKYIRLGRDVKGLSDANIDSSIKLIEGDKITKKNEKLYISGATLRALGSEDNSDSGSLVFKKGSDVKVFGIDFASKKIDIVIEEGAQVSFDGCSFAGTPKNYGKSQFKRSEFKTGKIENYGEANYENMNEPENVAVQNTTQLICPVFDKKFTVNKSIEEELKVTTDKNERVQIKEAMFVKDNNETTSYLDGLSIINYYSVMLSGTPKKAGDYKVRIKASFNSQELEKIFVLKVEPSAIPEAEFEIDTSALTGDVLQGSEGQALDKKLIKLSGKDKDKATFTSIKVRDLTNSKNVNNPESDLGLIIAPSSDKKEITIEGTPTPMLAKGRYQIVIEAVAEGTKPKNKEIGIKIEPKQQELTLVSNLFEKMFREGEKIENGILHITDSLGERVTVKEAKFIINGVESDEHNGMKTVIDSNGILSINGTPEKEGVYKLLVKAENTSDRLIETVFDLTVNPKLPDLSTVSLVSNLSGRSFELNKTITDNNLIIKDSRGFFVEVSKLNFLKDGQEMTSLDGMYLREMEGFFAITGTPEKVGKYTVKVMAELKEKIEKEGIFEFEVKDYSLGNQESKPETENSQSSESETNGYVFIPPVTDTTVSEAHIDDAKASLTAVTTTATKPERIELKIGSGKIKIQNKGFDEKELSANVAVFKKGDKVMLPLRSMTNALGFNVSWSQKERKVTLERNDSTIILYLKSDTVYINGKKSDIKIHHISKKRRVFLPLDELAKLLNVEKDTFVIK